jgi:hypothetical protein
MEHHAHLTLETTELDISWSSSTETVKLSGTGLASCAVAVTVLLAELLICQLVRLVLQLSIDLRILDVRIFHATNHVNWYTTCSSMYGQYFRYNEEPTFAWLQSILLVSNERIGTQQPAAGLK